MDNKIVLKIVAICAAVFLIFGVITAVLAVGYFKTNLNEENVFSIGKYSEPFEYHKNEVIGLAEIADINVIVVSSEIIFYQSESDLEVTLDCYGYTNAETITLYTEKLGSTLTVQVKYPKLFLSNLNITESVLKIGIPADYSENININGVSSEISMRDYLENSLSLFEVNTVSGDAQITCNSINSLVFDSTSGDLEVSDTVVSSVKADTTSGNIEVKNVGDECTKVSANTVSGRVLIYYDKVCETIIDTTSGDVTLYIPEGSMLDLDFDSVSGNLNGNYTSNSAGTGVSVDTVSGNLTIN